MYLVAGLGNPGRKYDGTRHNIGFMVIDRLAYRLSTAVSKSECKGLTGSSFYNGKKVMLAKPQTYMNLSGECIRALSDYYGVETDHELIVIVDDINLDAGKIRIRGKGSAGGHNGLKNIISHLGGDDFIRIRIGVGGNDPRENLIDHVLGHFPKDQAEIMDDAIDKACDSVLCILEDGIDAAMNRFNG